MSLTHALLLTGVLFLAAGWLASRDRAAYIRDWETKERREEEVKRERQRRAS